MSAFAPSQVVLGFPPLVDTMEKTERECAAALIVRACQALGDTWKPVDIDQLCDVMKRDLAEKQEPVTSLMGNPFFRPDFHQLADGKYGRWCGTPGESPIELTELGIASLGRWVQVTP